MAEQTTFAMAGLSKEGSFNPVNSFKLRVLQRDYVGFGFPTFSKSILFDKMRKKENST